MEPTKLKGRLSFTLIYQKENEFSENTIAVNQTIYFKQCLFQIAVSFQHCIMYREKILTTSKSYFCLFYWVQERLQLVAEHTSTQK